jgi:hypothetical protein
MQKDSINKSSAGRGPIGFTVPIKRAKPLSPGANKFFTGVDSSFDLKSRR